MNMAKFKISNFFIYRWRNVIGYSLVAIGLILILIFISLYLPGGITNAEIQSVIKSNSINMFDYWSMNVINLPYHLLQHTSFFLFGVTIFSIKLPSIILAFLSIVGLTLLLRQWFNPNIGILATLIAITTGQLLFIAQSGTSEILYLFWPVWILLLATFSPEILESIFLESPRLAALSAAELIRRPVDNLCIVVFKEFVELNKLLKHIDDMILVLKVTDTVFPDTLSF